MTAKKGNAPPARRWGSKTVDERRAERRDRIMAIAIQLYGREGFRNVSVKLICATARLSERYLYESFENNEHLLRQCFSKVNSELIAELREAAYSSSGDTQQKLRTAILVYLRRLRDDLAAARLFLIEMVNVSPQAETLFLKSLDEFGELLIDILGTSEERGRDISPLLLRGVIGGGFHIARAWIVGGCAEDINHVADSFLLLYKALLDPD